MWQLVGLLLALLLARVQMQTTPKYGNDLDASELQIYAQSIVEYGAETSIILTMKKFPQNYAILVRVNTPKYMIAYFRVGPNEPLMPHEWKEMKNASNVLADENIEANATYETGYYLDIPATYFILHDSKLILRAEVPDKPWIENLKMELPVKVVPPNEKCVPILEFSKCMNPDEPEVVHISHNPVLKSFVVADCGGIPDTEYVWHVMDIVESADYEEYQTINATVAVEPFTLKHKAAHSLWLNLYTIRLEWIFNEMKIATRCYLRCLLGKVEAVIGGGAKRVAQRDSVIFVDGTQSRDYSKPKKDMQFAVYHWSCESWEDYHNKYCTKNLSTASEFKIAPKTFKTGSSYSIRLKVKSDIDPNIVSRAYQTITVVDYPMLQVMIICLTNCHLDLYNPRSKVQLTAKCLNCAAKHLKYHWTVNSLMSAETRSLTVSIITADKIARIHLSIYESVDKYGSDVKYLTKNLGPTEGTCSVAPAKGLEYSTKFYVCCRNFETKNKPIEYYYFSKRVLLSSCYDCGCEIYLPLSQYIKVLVCDSYLACNFRILQVEVEAAPNMPGNTVAAVFDFMNTAPNDVAAIFDKGLEQSAFAILAALCSRLNNFNVGNQLLKAFDYYQPQSYVSLGRLANLTLTFAMRLTPIDISSMHLLARSLAVLNDNFQALYDDEKVMKLIEQPLINITQACVSVYNLMDRLSKTLPRPPKDIYLPYMQGPLNQELVEGLIEKISQYPDALVRFRAISWLESNWQTERLYRYLGFAREQGLQPDRLGEIVSAGVSLQEQCFNHITGRDYIIKTNDDLHRVYFSSALVEELKNPNKDRVCLKVVSVIRDLNWWYPEEKQPSTVLLSVRIYTDTDNFTVERQLNHSQISFTTIIGKYKPAVMTKGIKGKKQKHTHKEKNRATLEKELWSASAYVNLLEHHPSAALTKQGGASPEEETDEGEHISNVGTYINCREDVELKYLQDVVIFRLLLDGDTMLAVRFMNSTHKLRVLLQTHKLPQLAEISKSECFVPPNTHNKTMLLRNLCKEAKRTFMAVRIWTDEKFDEDEHTPLPDGSSVTFSFVFQLRACDFWKYSAPGDTQHWSHEGCRPSQTYTLTEGMHCTCNVLGTYTNYVYNTPAIVVPIRLSRDRAEYLHVVIFYLVLCIFIVLLLLYLYRFHTEPPVKMVMCRMTGMEEKSSREQHDLLVFIKTGGRRAADTTADVKISFITTQKNELQFSILQDPEKPVLEINTTHVLWLRTRDIRIPTTLAISHNNRGRYPSWFVRRIELRDLQTQQSQLFIVRRWLRDKVLMLTSSLIFQAGDKVEVGNWGLRFKTYFERQWINWGLFQPLTGAWRDTPDYRCMNRFQRVCIFVAKVCVSLCVAACYMGRSSNDTLEEDQYQFVQYSAIVKCSIICYFVNTCVDFTYKVIIWHWILGD